MVKFLNPQFMARCPHKSRYSHKCGAIAWQRLGKEPTYIGGQLDDIVVIIGKKSTTGGHFQPQRFPMIGIKRVAHPDKVGNDWLGSGYYDKAEGFISNQWKNLVWPLIMKADFTDVLEIASGHGRNTALLLPLCQSFVASDINAENTDFLAHRFP